MEEKSQSRQNETREILTKKTCFFLRNP